MYKLLTLIVTIISIQANGASLNKLFQDPQEFDPNTFSMGKNQPILIDDRILFAGRTTNGSALWTLDINTLEKVEILQGYGLNSRVNFIRMGEFVFFKFNTDFSSGEKIWKSDGTVEGTTLFYSEDKLDSFSQLNKSGSVFHTQTDDDELLVSDGIQTVIHPLDPSFSGGVCAFNATTVVAFDDIDDTPRYRWSNGNEVIELDFDLPESYFNYNSDVVAYNNSCYVIAPVDGSERGGAIWEIDIDGQISLVNTPAEIGQDVWQLVTHRDRLYLSSFYTVNNVFLLSEDLSAVESFYESYDFPRLTSSGPFISLMTFPPTSPPIIGISYLTADFFQQVAGFGAGGSSFENAAPNNFYRTSKQWVMEEPYFVSITDEIKSLVFDPFTAEQLKLNLPEVEKQSLITSENSDRIFVVSYDKSSRGTLNEVVSTPKIGTMIDGSWIEPNIKNQGLMLRTGKRLDGSEYLIATIYTYDNNGEQLWLAGVKNIDTNMDSIILDLSTYNGINFFQGEVDAEATPFGTMTLKLTSCNRLDMELNTPIGTENHSMYRIDDVRATQFCVDQ